MGKPNYSFEKRQKELDRKRKKEEKLHRKQEKAPDADASLDAGQEEDVTDVSTPVSQRPEQEQSGKNIA
jgi:hypothetical protein